MSGSYAVILWNYIRRGLALSSYLQFEVGDGSRVKTWQDHWCKENSLAIHAFLSYLGFAMTSRPMWQISRNTCMGYSIGISILTELGRIGS